MDGRPGQDKDEDEIVREEAPAEDGDEATEGEEDDGTEDEDVAEDADEDAVIDPSHTSAA